MQFAPLHPSYTTPVESAVALIVPILMKLILTKIETGRFFIPPRKIPDFHRPRKTPIFEDGDGVRLFKTFVVTLGTEAAQILGIIWGKIPKNPQISEWGWGQNL